MDVVINKEDFIARERERIEHEEAIIKSYKANPGILNSETANELIKHGFAKKGVRVCRDCEMIFEENQNRKGFKYLCDSCFRDRAEIYKLKQKITKEQNASIGKI